MKKEIKNLKQVIADLNKKHGADSIREINDNDERGVIDSISTGCYSLDNIFGCNGVPLGRIIDIYGNPSGGKSVLAMYIVGQIQKNGGKAAWLDAEYAWSNKYAKKIGVDTKTLLLSQPETCEVALDMVEKLVNTGELDVIVVDSTAALVPSQELKNDIEKSTVALQARLLSKGLRMITGVASRSKTIIIFISQTRDKIGVFFGPTQDSTGGKALKFYASVRLKVSKIKTLKDKNDVVIGNRLRIEATKNKVGLPFRKAEIDLDFEKGIDVVGDIVDQSIKNGILLKEGNTYLCKKNKIVGLEKVKIYLHENEEEVNILKEKLLTK
ncbi:MAG: recombinase RecA [Promethearchaeia archaeon]